MDIVSKDLLLKVGNSEKIHVRKYVWIPNLAKGKISSCISYDSNVHVKSLILHSDCWDVPKLNELFLRYEVESIKRTPIGQFNSPDAR